MARSKMAILSWTGIFLIAFAGAFALADALPATAPAASASLGKGRLVYVPPDGWELVASASNDQTAAYISANHLGILAIQLLPTDAVVDASAGPAIVRQLKANHTRANQKMLLAPTIVNDARFSLAIHERYDDAQGNANDELHLYKKAGPLGVMLTVNARTAESNVAKAIHTTGEDVMVSAKAKKNRGWELLMGKR
jgi:hypothetical protein